MTDLIERSATTAGPMLNWAPEPGNQQQTEGRPYTGQFPRVLPAPTPPVGVHGELEPSVHVAAVVTVQVSLDRDHLAGLAVEGVNFTNVHPDQWSVDFTRAIVGSALVQQSVRETDNEAAECRWLAYGDWESDDPDDLERRDNVRAVYRAVDRAFPQHTATRLSGFAEGTHAECVAGDWQATGACELVAGAALAHYEEKHGACG